MDDIWEIELMSLKIVQRSVRWSTAGANTRSPSLKCVEMVSPLESKITRLPISSTWSSSDFIPTVFPTRGLPTNDHGGSSWYWGTYAPAICNRAPSLRVCWLSSLTGTILAPLIYLSSVLARASWRPLITAPIYAKIDPPRKAYRNFRYCLPYAHTAS